MTTKFNKPGDTIDHTNSSGAAINVNDVVVIGVLLAVALTNIPVNATGSVGIKGVWTLPKVGGTAMPEGTVVTWDHVNKHFIVGAGASGDVAGGAVVVEQGALAADTAVRVLLTPAAGAVVA
ncbi:capsid cement protein [Rhodanobacter sp. BL-MT-08]